MGRIMPVIASLEENVLVEKGSVLLPQVIRDVVKPVLKPFRGRVIDELRVVYSHEFKLVILTKYSISLCKIVSERVQLEMVRDLLGLSWWGLPKQPTARQLYPIYKRNSERIATETEQGTWDVFSLLPPAMASIRGPESVLAILALPLLVCDSVTGSVWMKALRLLACN